MSHLRPLPITAYSMCTPLGGDRASVVAALRHGKSGLQPPPFPLPFSTLAGVVTADLPELPPMLASFQGRPARMAAHLIEGLSEPLAKARERWQPHRIGLVLGTSTAGARATEIAYQEYVATGHMPEAYDFRRQHCYGSVLEVIKGLTGISGPSWVISTTCTSSAKTLATAQRLIHAGLLDAAVVGGFDTLCAVTLTGFRSLDSLSEVACKPFSSERNGINIGEGGALLLIEREGEGQALLEGVGESSDAYHISAPHPEGEGASTAMERALSGAGVRASDVDCINAHGTGTPLNDLAEAKAILRVFGAAVPVVSTKGFTGHVLGGAGATEAAISLLTLEEGFLPASLGLEPKDPRITINVSDKSVSGPFRRIMSNSFAFGGNNVCVLMRSV
jgi:3-oxoacyl-[acyl-carrier-protein] synthase I